MIVFAWVSSSAAAITKAVGFDKSWDIDDSAMLVFFVFCIVIDSI